MKAAVVSQKGRLEVWEVPTPQVGPYDVLCRLCYGATCAGTDIHLMDGQHPFPVSFPTILGHESVGRVVEAGSKVRNFKVGQLVSRVGAPAGLLPELGSNWGGFAEFGIARDHWQMRKDGVPEAEWTRNRVNQIIHPSIDERTAPMLITWRETLSYANRIGIHSGMAVLLVGSGANALSFAAHICNLGATAVIVGSPAKEAAFRKLPIAGYFSYREERLGEQIRGFCAQERLPERFDTLLDAVGGSATVNTLLPLLKKGGTLGVYGWNGRGQYGLNPFLASDSFRIYAGGYDEEESNAQAQTMVLRGALDASLWYDTEQPVLLEQILSAYDSLRRHERFKYLIQL